MSSVSSVLSSITGTIPRSALYYWSTTRKTSVSNRMFASSIIGSFGSLSRVTISAVWRSSTVITATGYVSKLWLTVLIAFICPGEVSSFCSVWLSLPRGVFASASIFICLVSHFRTPSLIRHPIVS